MWRRLASRLRRRRFHGGGARAEWWWFPPEGYPQRYGYTGDQYQPVDALFIQLVVGGWHWFRAWFDHDTINTLAIVSTAIFTGTLWRATNRLWRISQIQADHVERSVQASIRSATVAERALAFVERAWVDITVKPSGDIIFGADAITANVSRNIRNFDRSPALKTSPMQRLFPTYLAAVRAHDRIVEVFRHVAVDTPIPNTIGGMLAPNEPYEETIAIEMARPRDDDLPLDDSEEDHVGLFVLAGVSYTSPASTRLRYITGIFEIASRDGQSINFRNRGEFMLKADEIIIRSMGVSKAA